MRPSGDHGFCPRCGAPARPLGDDPHGHRRCTACAHTQWRNPLPVAGVLLVREGRVLLTRRDAAVEHGGGRWAYPGGYVEAGETAEEAALRETCEEVGLDATLTGVVGRPESTLDPPTLVVAYRGEASGEPRAGDETAEARWFAPDEIPWDEIAFPTTTQALRQLIAEGLDAPPAYPLRPRDVGPRPPQRAVDGYCRRCGERLRAPAPHERGHARCSSAACGFVHWDNPATGAGVFIVRDRRVLLARRGPTMSRGGGRWVGPGGHMEAGETPEAGLRREVREEVGVEVTITALVGVYSERHPAVVHVSYAGATAGEPRALHETSEVRWFARDEIPWGELFEDSVDPMRDLLARGLV